MLMVPSVSGALKEKAFKLVFNPFTVVENFFADAD